MSFSSVEASTPSTNHNNVESQSRADSTTIKVLKIACIALAIVAAAMLLAPTLLFVGVALLITGVMLSYAASGILSVSSMVIAGFVLASAAGVSFLVLTFLQHNSGQEHVEKALPQS